MIPLQFKFMSKFKIGILLLAATAAAIYLFGPPSRETLPEVAGDTYPWQLKTSPTGGVRVFGVTLGKSTLRQAVARLGIEPKLGIFVSADGKRSLEAYFDRISLGGLSAKVVLRLGAGEAQLEALAQRARRSTPLLGGRLRIELVNSALAEAQGLLVNGLTYIPAVQLKPETVRGHFGEPAERYIVSDNETHWLYPGEGLDVALYHKGKDVLQYFLPTDLERVRQPLARLSQHEP